MNQAISDLDETMGWSDDDISIGTSEDMDILAPHSDIDDDDLGISMDMDDHIDVDDDDYIPDSLKDFIAEADAALKNCLSDEADALGVSIPSLDGHHLTDYRDADTNCHDHVTVDAAATVTTAMSKNTASTGNSTMIATTITSEENENPNGFELDNIPQQHPIQNPSHAPPSPIQSHNNTPERDIQHQESQEPYQSQPTVMEFQSPPTEVRGPYDTDMGTACRPNPVNLYITDSAVRRIALNDEPDVCPDHGEGGCNCRNLINGGKSTGNETRNGNTDKMSLVNGKHEEGNYICRIASDPEQNGDDSFEEDSLNCPTVERLAQTNQPQNPVFQSPNEVDTAEQLLVMNHDKNISHMDNNENHNNNLGNEMDVEMEMERNMNMSTERNMDINMDIGMEGDADDAIVIESAMTASSSPEQYHSSDGENQSPTSHDPQLHHNHQQKQQPPPIMDPQDTFSPTSSSEMDIPHCATLKQSNVTVPKPKPEPVPRTKTSNARVTRSSTSANVDLRNSRMNSIRNRNKAVMAKRRSTVKPNISPVRKMVDKQTLRDSTKITSSTGTTTSTLRRAIRTRSKPKAKPQSSTMVETQRSSVSGSTGVSTRSSISRERRRPTRATEKKILSNKQTNNDNVVAVPKKSRASLLTKKVFGSRSVAPAPQQKSFKSGSSTSTSTSATSSTVSSRSRSRRLSTVPKGPNLKTRQLHGDRQYSGVGFRDEKKETELVERSKTEKPKIDYRTKALTVPKTPNLVSKKKLGARKYSNIGGMKRIGEVEKEDVPDIDYKTKPLTKPVAPKFVSSEKYGERQYSVVGAREEKLEVVKEEVHIDYKTKPLTKPVAPKFMSSEKYGERQYSVVGAREEKLEVVKEEVHIDYKTKPLTVPKTPTLISRQKLGDRKYSGVGKREEVMEVITEEKPTEIIDYKTKPLTVPKSFTLSTTARALREKKSHNAQLSSSNNETQAFKAKPIMAGVLHPKKAGVSKKSKKAPTVPKPFRLQTDERIPEKSKKVEEPKAKQKKTESTAPNVFHARPMPDFSNPLPINHKSNRRVTAPKPFSLRTEEKTSPRIERIAKASEQAKKNASMSVQEEKKKVVTTPIPFNFTEPVKLSTPERERIASESTPFGKRVKSTKPVTTPIPFQFETREPSSVAKTEGITPSKLFGERVKSAKPPTTPVPFRLLSEERANSPTKRVTKPALSKDLVPYVSPMKKRKVTVPKPFRLSTSRPSRSSASTSRQSKPTSSRGKRHTYKPPAPPVVKRSTTKLQPFNLSDSNNKAKSAVAKEDNTQLTESSLPVSTQQLTGQDSRMQPPDNDSPAMDCPVEFRRRLILRSTRSNDSDRSEQARRVVDQLEELSTLVQQTVI